MARCATLRVAMRKARLHHGRVLGYAGTLQSSLHACTLSHPFTFRMIGLAHLRSSSCLPVEAVPGLLFCPEEPWHVQNWFHM